MREVQFRGNINSDFLIMYADTITNLDLTKAISTHFHNKSKLKNVVLTTIMREGGIDSKIHVLNKKSNKTN